MNKNFKRFENHRIDFLKEKYLQWPSDALNRKIYNHLSASIRAATERFDKKVVIQNIFVFSMLLSAINTHRLNKNKTFKLKRFTF